MAKLETILPGAFVEARSQVTLPTSIGGIAALFGQGKRGVSGLALALVNETGTFKNYVSSRRNIERYLMAERGEPGQTRHPSKATASALERLANSRADVAEANAILREGVTVDFSGPIIVSPGHKRSTETDRDITGVYIPPEDAAPFLHAMLQGRLTESADEFNAAFMSAYGIGNAYITDVNDLRFTIGEQ